MGNTFGAHIFKRRSVGEREEVTIKLFELDGTPIDLSASPPAEAGGGMTFRGTWAAGTYQAGDVVTHAGSTYAREMGPGTDTPGVGANVDFGLGVFSAPRLRLPEDLTIDFDTTTDPIPAYASVPGKLFYFDVAEAFMGTFRKLSGPVDMLSRFRSPTGVDTDKVSVADNTPMNLTVGRWFVCIMPNNSGGNEATYTYEFFGATSENVVVPSGIWTKLP